MRWRNRKARLARSHAGQRLSASHGVRQILVIATRESRLVVPQIHLRWRAGHEKIDRALGLWSKVRHVVGCRRWLRITRRSNDVRRQGAAKQSGKTCPAKRLAHAAEEMSARCQPLPLFTKFERDWKVVNRGSRAAMIRTASAFFVKVRSHLFNTASRFMAALATSIHEASSSARIPLS